MRYMRPRSSAKPIKPNTTGTRMTRNCNVIEPLRWPRELFWILMTTRTYKLRPLLLGGIRGQEGDGEIGKLDLFIGTQRLHKMGRNKHQQLGVGFLGRAAAEQFAENRNAAEPGNLVDGFDNTIVDQPRDCETFTVAKDHFRVGLP